MSTGSLAIKIVKANFAVQDDEAEKTVYIRVRIGADAKTTKQFKPNEKFEQTINFALKNAAASEEVVIEAHITEKDKKSEKVANSFWKVPLAAFTTDEDWSGKTLTQKDSKTSLQIESKWTMKHSLLETATESVASAAESIKATAVSFKPQNVLAVQETHRPWFMRVGYYYDTTKNVYNYTTSFRVIAPVARFGENTTNTVLKTVTGKTLGDLDAGLVTPSLNTIDNAVDSTISVGLSTLVAGQNLVIDTKNRAVNVASAVVGGTVSAAGSAANYTTSTVKSVASTSYNAAASVTNYTTSSVASVAKSGYNTAASVTDYTTTQVSNASSSAFGKVRGATVYVASSVPYLGTKIRA